MNATRQKPLEPQAGNERGDGWRRSAAVALAITDVFLHGEVGKQGMILVDDADLAMFGRQMGHITSVDQDATLVDGRDANDGLQKKGFAGAGGTKQGKRFPGRHVQMNILQGEARQHDGKILHPYHDVRPLWGDTQRRRRKNTRQTRISPTATGWEYCSP